MLSKIMVTISNQWVADYSQTPQFLRFKLIYFPIAPWTHRLWSLGSQNIGQFSSKHAISRTDWKTFASTRKFHFIAAITKSMPLFRQQFKLHVNLVRMFSYFCPNVTDICPKGSIAKEVSIGSSNVLMPHRPQAITYTNDDPVRLFYHSLW